MRCADDAGEAVVSNEVLKIWDEDCQPNGIPDTCDVDCDGFEGLCSDFIACGGSSDANDNGIPDECNLPPVCTDAFADPEELWPPNHTFADVGVVGVTDPDDDPITITIDAIRQDEPVWAPASGAGRTAPDGMGVGTETASVRAERNGNPNTPGDGRFYHITFTADDGQGGSCSGEVTACVPHDEGGGADCVDGGPLFDSSSAAACGIGFELAFLLPPLMWAYGRRRRMIH
jgi:hypothetical protein